MQAYFAIAAAIALAASLLLAACHEGRDVEPTDPSSPAVTVAAVARGQAAGSPRERAVLAAMEQYKQAILDRDTAELAGIWTENYTFINPQGGLVTREERLANLGSGNTNVQSSTTSARSPCDCSAIGHRAEPVDAPRDLQRRADRHRSAGHVCVGAAERALAARDEPAHAGESLRG